MREIKFRAWDKEKQMMLDWQTLQSLMKLGINIFIPTEEYILMQYTGLEDKTGREVYGGDLLRNRSGRICKVVWLDHAGCWDATPVKCINEDNALGFETIKWCYHVEVIGNVWENPELLEVK